jgi:DNA-binding beta-propeller fold protein YncE
MQTRFRLGVVATMAMVLAASLSAAPKPKSKTQAEADAPEPMMLLGGRRLVYERAFSSEREVRLKKRFWARVLDLVAGPPDYHQLLRPYSLVTDSRGRIIVTDPDAQGVHIFDFANQKYKFIARENGRDAFQAPQCVAVDAKDNIYLTDSRSGKVFIYDANGKFKRVIGSLKNGEGYFKRPTGIAVDSAAERIYLTDTLRHKIFVLDLEGNVLQTIGKRGTDPGEFNFPTELRVHGQELLVVDAMNFRVQVLSRSGEFLYAVGRIGEVNGTMFRPKGVGIDSEGSLYVVDGLFDTVQAFNRKGQLLFYFGQSGDGPEEFQLPSGLFIDRDDRIYVADSYNHRVQVFRISGASPGQGGTQ